MATTDTNLAERSGNLVESHKAYDPRIIFFYFVLAALLVTLICGLAYRQLTQTSEHAKDERKQNQRRVLIPGPRGNIYDRNGKLLVGNDHRFAVLLHLDELKAELQAERIRIRNNYRKIDDKDIPSYGELQQIARVSIAQRYLTQVNRVLVRDEKIDSTKLQRHFTRRLLLPYELVNNLDPTEYARLIENLPVRSPLEVYANNVRSYPYGAAAAHTLGYVRPTDDFDAAGFPGKDLTTFRTTGTIAKDGLEKWFDDHLTGEPGGRIYRVDPSGYKINPPLESRAPKQGKHLTTSLDIDLQLVAEEMIGNQTGAAVAIDIATGEVLVMASKPSYDLGKFSPRASHEVVAEMNERGAWTNLAMNGFFAPGSTFKILTSIAGLRAGVITPDKSIVFCGGYYPVGGRAFPCDVGNGHHGNVLLRDAIAHSCDIYYYKAAELMKPEVLGAEARRFHFDRPTGIELPGEQDRMIVPDPEWKLKVKKERWMPGDTANVSIGQGALDLTPLQMACFTASVARGELFTKPTLLHEPNRSRQRNEPIGLTAAQHRAIVEGMAGTVTRGTAKIFNLPAFQIPGVQFAAKTGTAQKDVTIDGRFGKINLAWFICFAPIEKPEIAIAVMIRGDKIGEDFYGSANAGPVAHAILKTHFAKKAVPKNPITLAR